MFLRKILIFIYLFTTINFISKGQDTSRSAKSYFKASVNYLSNSVYNGRKDSAVLPYITPSLGYFNKSGFYVTGSFSYLMSAAYSGIDLFTIQSGYDFNFSDKFYGGIYGSKYFYNNASTDVRAETKGGVGGNLSYETKIISFTSGIASIFSSKTDINLYESLSHTFFIGEDWGISPAVTMNLGSQNYYQDFIVNRKSISGSRGRGKGRGGSGSGRNNGNSGGGNITSTITTSSAQFGILDYEISVPISFYGNKWGIYFTPTYAVPQNPVSVKSTVSNVYTAEKLENSFYGQLTAYIKF